MFSLLAPFEFNSICTASKYPLIYKESCIIEKYQSALVHKEVVKWDFGGFDLSLQVPLKVRWPFNHKVYEKGRIIIKIYAMFLISTTNLVNN